MKTREFAEKLRENIGKVIKGKEKETDLATAALLCAGHVLLEDVPGTGKTMFARALADCGAKVALLDLNEKAAQEIHPNNCKRVIRAIEFYEQTGQKISEHNEQERQKESPYNSAYLVLTDDRQVLYDRINLRVDIMLSEGLEAEARAFYERKKCSDGTARQAIGCKEFIPYFEGRITFDEAVEAIKKETRHYAKRQLTWFNRMENVNKLYADGLSFDGILQEAVRMIEESGIF